MMGWVGAFMETAYFVYITSNSSAMLCAGVTNDVEIRVFQHKSKRIPGFTQRYNFHKLVYFEKFSSVREAIGRRNKLKVR